MKSTAKVPFTVYLDADFYLQLQQQAKESHLSLSWLAANFIRQGLQNDH